MNDLDYASKRAGSPHLEDVIGGQAKCGICGYVDEADPEDPVVREWHGDSFEEIEYVTDDRLRSTE